MVRERGDGSEQFKATKIIGDDDDTQRVDGLDGRERRRGWPPVRFSCVAIIGRGPQGTGFFVTPTSILTAHHIVPDVGSLKERTLVWGLFNGNRPAELVSRAAGFCTSEHVDFTVFSVDPQPGAHVLSLDDSADVAVGDPVTVYGNASGGPLRRSGADSAVVGVDDDHGLVHYRADTLPGGSGGPVLSSRTGRLLAMHLRQDGGESNRGRLISVIRRELPA